MSEENEPIDAFLIEHLRMWKDEGVPAPVNELQSIDAWLQCLQEHGAEETMNRMMMRRFLLIDAVIALNDAGPEAEEAAGIYDNRPDMKP